MREGEEHTTEVEALNHITTPPMAFLAVMSVGYFNHEINDITYFLCMPKTLVITYPYKHAI